MQTFKDANGNTWNISLTFGDMLRVKSLSGGKYDLLNPEMKINGSDFYQVLNSDFGEFYELLSYLLAEQFKQAGVDALQFAGNLSGESLIKAQAAFFSEWRDFFRQAQREGYAYALESMMRMNEQIYQEAKVKIESPEMKAMEAKISQAVQPVLNKEFGRLAASLDSTLLALLGDNSTT